MAANDQAARDPERDFPPAFYAVIRRIDAFSDATGRLFALTQVFLIVTITYEVCAR